MLCPFFCNLGAISVFWVLLLIHPIFCCIFSQSLVSKSYQSAFLEFLFCYYLFYFRNMIFKLLLLVCGISLWFMLCLPNFVQFSVFYFNWMIFVSIHTLFLFWGAGESHTQQSSSVTSGFALGITAHNFKHHIERQELNLSFLHVKSSLLPVILPLQTLAILDDSHIIYKLVFLLWWILHLVFSFIYCFSILQCVMSFIQYLDFKNYDLSLSVLAVLTDEELQNLALLKILGFL